MPAVQCLTCICVCMSSVPAVYIYIHIYNTHIDINKYTHIYIERERESYVFTLLVLCMADPFPNHWKTLSDMGGPPRQGRHYGHAMPSHLGEPIVVRPGQEKLWMGVVPKILNMCLNRLLLIACWTPSPCNMPDGVCTNSNHFFGLQVAQEQTIFPWRRSEFQMACACMADCHP